ncbi:hypothetical protein FIBSPDRAFT_928540 [Athelia psychrophila]|uniref:ubiquitinyl hydrolase 1 n=1 Tax=Athelia psychrophila TaxID=1759441 RepID=A0A166PYQ2_9AGAM|nr:hypothetical protein FIBSPDRAFT_928540 [Fibularhizoctonia sp. CBS 109695]
MDNDSLEYIANHAFFPPKLPQEDDYQICHEEALCSSVVNSALAYREHIPADDRDRWDRITKMLQHLQATQEFESLYKESLRESITGMQTGDIRALYIRAQNAGLVIRKLHGETVFETFEVSLPNATVMAAEGKILRSFPGPAIAVPHLTANDPFTIGLSTDFKGLLDRNRRLSHALEQHFVRCTQTSPSGLECAISALWPGYNRGPGRWRSLTFPDNRWLVVDTAPISGSAQIVHLNFLDGVLLVDGKPLSRLPETFTRHATFTRIFGKNIFDVIPANKNTGMDFTSRMELRDHKVSFAMRDQDRKLVIHIEHGCQTFELIPHNIFIGDLPASLIHGYSHWMDLSSGQVELRPLSNMWESCKDNWILHYQDQKGPIMRRGSTTLVDIYSSTFKMLHLSLDALDHAEHMVVTWCQAAELLLADLPRLRLSFMLNKNNLLESVNLSNMVVDENQSTGTMVGLFNQLVLRESESVLAGLPRSRRVIIPSGELWVAVDQLATAQCPLLREYSPEFPKRLMEPLLLRSSQALERAKYVETYVLSRHSHSQAGHRIFTDEVSPQSFAVRYFDSSSHHKAVLEQIRNRATSDRRAKVSELACLNEKHRDLVRDYGNRTHTQSRHYRYGYEYHDPYRCYRCSLERQADGMEIAVHEWPLPEDNLHAKAVVFELRCPSFFGTWRTISYQFLRDICFNHNSRVDPPVQLHTYQGLQSFRDDDCSHRISIASTTKAFTNCHYASTKIPSHESKVCVNNGLSWKLFDSSRREWAAISFQQCSIVDYCILKLPVGPYATLQYAVDATSHTSNEMLANQEDCPKDLSLHEYAAFVGLRAGCLLQWLNIARELRARALTFRREEILILFTQAAWEIGPLLNKEREWHMELCIGTFASVLLQELADLLTAVQSNWAEVKCVRVITALTSRLLVSSKDFEAVKQAYILMRRTRATTFTWMHQLADRLRENDDEARAQDLQRRMCEVAAACRSTYDVDPLHLQNLLSSSRDLSVLLECTIVVHDNSPSSAIGLSTDFKGLLDRNRRLSHALEQHFVRCTQANPSGLERAMSALWPAYNRGPDWWRYLTIPDNRWLVVDTAPISDSAQIVHLNFLDGVLLVDGKPLSRLPEIFTRHATFTRIFGKNIFDVIPANKNTGMDFTSRMELRDHKVSFAMRDQDCKLVIHIARGCQTFELIPHNIFIGDLPASLIHGYSHWMDLSSGQVELRPLSNIWESCKDNWILHYQDPKGPIMRRGSTTLVDIHSSTFKMLHLSLDALDHAEHMVVTWCQAAELLLADLPRLRLSFMLKNNHLESVNLSNMVVDEKQSTGTMVGLFNQLVLRESESALAGLPRSRRVIIPFGELVEEATLAYSREWLSRDLGRTWISIYNLCRRSEKNKDLFRLAFSLSAMAYCSEQKAKLVPVLLAFATNPRFRDLSPPPWGSSYRLQSGFQPSRDEVYRHVISEGSFESSSEARLASRNGENEWDASRRRQALYETRLKLQADRVANHYLAQWPIQYPNSPPAPSDNWVFSASKALAAIGSLFDTRFRNMRLKQHIVEVQDFLSDMDQPAARAKFAYHPSPCFQPSNHTCCAVITLNQLFQREPPSILRRTPILRCAVDQQYETPDDTGDLHALLTHFTGNTNSFEKLYGQDLEESRQEYMAHKNRVFSSCIPPSYDLADYKDQCWSSLQEALECALATLAPSNLAIHQHMVHLAGQWPCITLGSLLRILGNRGAYNISSTWINTLATLAQRMLLYQRSQSWGIQTISLRSWRTTTPMALKKSYSPLIGF